MAPAPHSCPHCLGQGEKKLLFREAKAELTLVNHASSHAPSSPLCVWRGGGGFLWDPRGSCREEVH